MAGDTKETTTTQTSPPGGPQVLSELQPFLQRIGQMAYQSTFDPNLQLQNYTTGARMEVPGLTPMEQLAHQQIADRGLYGIPTPPSEATAGRYAAALPGAAGQQVPLSQNTRQGLGTSQHLMRESSQINPYSQQGLNTMQQYAGGDFGSSPAMQQALRGIERQILPAVQNQEALSGRANSGYLNDQVARAYARELVPLHMQGMQQQQAAGQQLFTSGQAGQDQYLRGLQQFRDTQMNTGQQEQQLGSEAAARGLQGAQAAIPILNQIGQQEAGRPIEAIRELMTAGGDQRQIQTAQNQAGLDAYLRNREIALSMMNPFGGFSATTSPPALQTQTRKSSGGGWGLSKSLVPWIVPILGGLFGYA